MFYTKKHQSPRRAYWAYGFIALTALVSHWHSGAHFGALLNRRGWQGFSEMLAGLAHPDLSAKFVSRIADLALESLLIGILGTALALLLATGLAIVSAHFPQMPHGPVSRRRANLCLGILRSLARSTLAFFRAIPEILWAFLFVRIFGLGPGPAVLAIGITFAGTIGKLFAELIESVDPRPARRLRAAGASGIAIFLYGILPLVRRQWVAYALFRLECAIRSASILGIVGAGGLGLEIDLSIRYFQYEKLATALLAVIVYIVLLEVASHTLRRIRPRWSVMSIWAGALVAILHLNIPWGELLSPAALEQARKFLRGFAAPTLDSSFLKESLHLAFTTVSMAWIATLIAASIALVLAPMASTRFTVGGYLQDAPSGRGPTRWLYLLVLIPTRMALQISRALPELVWAVLFILWVGPGVTAGILALCVHTIGILGRLYSDALEETEPAAPRALQALGAGPLARYIYGVLPQSTPRMLAFTLFRFEVNVRAAAMVGFVGAGGLGDALHTAISLFHMRDLATLLLITLALVLLIDSAGSRLRLKILRR